MLLQACKLFLEEGQKEKAAQNGDMKMSREQGSSQLGCGPRALKPQEERNHWNDRQRPFVSQLSVPPLCLCKSEQFGMKLRKSF